MDKLKKKALSLLAIREYSRSELFDKIRINALNDTEVNKLLDELEQDGYLSEERFVNSYINSKKSKYGSLKIQYLLRNKRADINLINKYISNIDMEDEKELAYKLLEKKLGNNFDDKAVARGIRFLQSRGFSLEIIMVVLKRLKKYSPEL